MNIRISDIQENAVNWKTVPYCDISDKEIEAYLLAPNDILFARTGGTVGKSYIVSDVPEPAIYAGYLIRTRYSTKLVPQFLKYFMDSELYWNQLRSGTKVSAQPNCNGKTLSKMILPVPPIEEQQRIVDRVDHLMAVITEFEQMENQIVSLKAEFPTNLRASILQSAIQGKLVEQRAEEGTGEELYQEIQKEKARLIKEGKLKKEKPLPEITEDEIPFDIPESWKWVRLIDLCKSIADGDHQPPPQVPSGIPFVVISNVSSGKLSLTNTRYVPESYFKKLSSERIAEVGDILFTVTGSFGIPVKVEYNAKFCFQRHIALIKLMIKWDYIFWVLKSNLVYSQCDRFATGTAQRTVSIRSLRSIIIPLPPLAEQRRIVAKLNEMLPLCEGLK